MVELRLNDGTRLELRGDEVIALTYAVNDIGSIETRQGVSSNEFELPITDFNLNALGYPTNFNVNQDVNPFTKIGAEIYEEELRIAKGYIQITNPSLSGNTIPVVFFGENAEWFNLIKGKSIRELDLTEFDHEFNPTAIEASFANTEGYKYSLIDRNGLNFNTSNVVACQCFTLSTFQSSILEAIISEIGFKLKGDLLLDPLFKKTVIVDTNDRFYALGERVDRNLSIGTTGDQAVPAGTTDNVRYAVNDLFNDESELFINNEYTIDTNAFLAVSSRIVVQNLGASSTDVTFRLLVNGSPTDVVNQSLPSGAEGNFTITIGDTFIGDKLYKEFNAGDIISFDISTTSELVVIKPSSDFNAGTGVGTVLQGYLTIEANTLAVEGATVNIAATLPDIDQADFVKELVFDHNALIQVNLNTKEITFNAKRYSYDNVLDWSNIIDLSEDVGINYTDIVENYARINDVRRAETDGAFIKEYNSKNRINYGDGRINLDNDFLDSRDDLFESEFGGTYTINSLDTNQALPYIIGETISDTILVTEFQNQIIRIPLDSEIDDFLDVPPNTIWALVTDEVTNTTFNRAYSIFAITKTATQYQIGTDADFGTLKTGDEAVVRLIRREEEATPRKLIDAGNYNIEENNDTYTDIDIVTTNGTDTTITEMPYFYFWNPIIGKPTDVNSLSLSYGNINIPSICSNLLDDYYKNTISILQSGKILRASFRLSQVDIFNLDFNKLVYLNFYLNGQNVQGYFIINKIEEYTGSEDSTVVELIKY